MLASSATGAFYTNNTDWAGANWALANGDVVGGIHTNVGQFSIPSGAIVTVQPYAAAATNMGRVTVFAASADIQGTLSANQAGFPTQTGPGAGAGRAGGGYGGHGSTGDGGLGGSPYGSVREPVDLGSGGSFSNTGYVAGRGGGAIRIWVAGVLILDGALSANGQNGVSNWTGGGSGGSVWLSAATVSGSGSVTANGGNGTSQGGGGSGGRIAFTTGNNTFAGTYKAQGGTGARGPAGNGTFNFMDHYGPGDDLLIKAHIALPPATDWSFRNLAVSSNVTFEIQSTTAVVSRVKVVQNVLIPATAQLSANGLGHARFSGPGAGVGRGGASFGGRGSQSAGAGIAPNPFGSVRAPDQLGSGGANLEYGGRGGGALLLNADGTVTVHGMISADGWPPINGWGGPGSGGSVSITAGVIAGAGIVQANGGTATSGGAGGGRIAFTTATNRFTGIIRATGSGSGAFNRAGHGTFNFADHFGPTNDLVISGDIALPPATNYSFRSLTVTNGATLEIQSTPEIATLITVATEVVVAPGAAIVADDLGFANKQGPGAAIDRSGWGGRIAVWHGTIREHEKADILVGKTFSRLFIETMPPDAFAGEAWGARRTEQHSHPNRARKSG